MVKVCDADPALCIGGARRCSTGDLSRLEKIGDGSSDACCIFTDGVFNKGAQN